VTLTFHIWFSHFLPIFHIIVINCKPHSEVVFQHFRRIFCCHVQGDSLVQVDAQVICSKKCVRWIGSFQAILANHICRRRKRVQVLNPVVFRCSNWPKFLQTMLQHLHFSCSKLSESMCSRLSPSRWRQQATPKHGNTMCANPEKTIVVCCGVMVNCVTARWVLCGSVLSLTYWYSCTTKQFWYFYNADMCILAQYICMIQYSMYAVVDSFCSSI